MRKIFIFQIFFKKSFRPFADWSMQFLFIPIQSGRLLKTKLF
jgi:hypothetical protein